MSQPLSLTLQQLPSAAARLCLDVEKFILRELNFDPKGKEIILAFSGGADSKALFFILLVLAPRLGFKLSLAHLDHALRPTSADERKAAEELADSFGIPHKTARVDVAAVSASLKLGKEEAGRVARLQFLQSLQKNDPDCWVAYGHQLNDLAEDVLMRLIRGSGWPALGGMQALDEKRCAIRPLLTSSRSSIEDFLQAMQNDMPQGLSSGLASWIDDPMNQDTAFLRNRVRASILPLFIEENPSFLESVADLWRLASYDAELYAQLIKPGMGKADPLTLPHSSLANLPKALRLRLYKEKLEALGPGQPLLRNLLALDKAWSDKKTGAEIQFPGHKKARLQRGEIKFSRG